MGTLCSFPLADGGNIITMSHRLTKEELDAQFEQFLKESVSDDSIDLGSPDKQPHAKTSQKSSQKPSVAPWQDDDHSSAGTGRAETAKRRFIKARKAQPENNEDFSRESFNKPVPKPRCNAPDKPIISEESHKSTVLGDSQTVERHKAPSDDLCSHSLSRSMHESLQCVTGERSPDDITETPPASTDSLSQGDSEDGLLEFAKSVRKSLRNSQPIREEDEDPEDAGLKKEGMETAFLNRDSTETEDSGMAPAVNMTSMGLDTLEEEEEKARFFAQLEAGALSTIDYSKLNRDLDSTSCTIATNLGKAEDVKELSDGQSEVRVPETRMESPAFTGSPHYSDDFEDEKNAKKPLEEKCATSAIFARVSLYDSLDETGDRRKDTEGSLDKGHSYLQSGGSDMEALQEAYRQVHVVEDSDDYNRQNVSVEGRGKINRPVSPFSPPQHARQSLQPASTNESELPTEEELMRRIRPEKDQIRGFTLQPVSAVEFNQEKESQFLDKTDVPYTESQGKKTRKSVPVSGVKGARGHAGHQSSSPHPPKHDLTWSIKEEVERLMQDQNSYSSYTTFCAGKAKKQQASHGSTVFKPSTPSVGKPTAAAVKGRRVDERTAIAPRLFGPSRAATTTARTHTSVSRFPQHPPKAKFTKNQEKDHCDSATDSDLKVSSELVASVQSLVAVLQQQMDTSTHQDAAQEVRGLQETRETRHLPQFNRDEQSSVVEELKVQLAQKERELQMMKKGAEELSSLKQQNFLLQSKLQTAEEASRKKSCMETADPATEEKLQEIDKEIKEQETLIKGYQQENEKLYLQMKAQQATSKANEEAMFNENQRLLNELAFTREQLNKTSRPVGNVCLMDHTQRITGLLAQVQELKRNEAKLYVDIHNLKQENKALEVDLQLIKNRRDLAKDQTISTSGDKTSEMGVLENKHREEVVALKKKLQWFAKNQVLLDRDAGRLKAATAEIQLLKDQVETLKQAVGKRSTEQQRRAREKSLNMKRMQDLERQVKELEQILRSRNPNSLPALIYAAATAASHEDVGAAKTSPPSQITALLERRIQRLETELESHDEEAKCSLRAMEQQFHRIKLRYEQQISELEQQLQQKQQDEGAGLSKPWMSKIQTLEEKLQREKESSQEKENSLQNLIQSLQQQLKHKENPAPQKTQPSPGRQQRQAEAAFGIRIERLNQEVATKTRTIQDLTRTVERLQKERRNMLSLPNLRPEIRSTESKQQQGLTKTLCSPTIQETCAGEETFPAAQYEKTYQPTVFTGSHISEVLQENEALKQRVELLELQGEQEREALKADAVQAKEELCRLKEHFAEQLSSMKAEHLLVVDRLRATHALEHSSSKVAELTNKLNTQEIWIKQLQEQLKELQGSKDALAISRTRENVLQEQLTILLQELKEAKEAQSPEVKLLCSLETKILNIELKYQHKEEELQQVIEGAWQTAGVDHQSEVERWKRLAQDKSRQLEVFRLELDSILDILRHLQRHGLVLPTPDLPVTALFPQTT
ncbi:centrosomal protein of 162 kDa isoform X3 [Amphiprion ocellaris]|uniref:centrosomal protein of 162 kDa isoform X3 n=1 Tax=Amphiprion ocellaris TaxID=80972 RepID=UPI002410FF88|nr:centrosomal protein of 162 kDa isoform X3 [Amphiprion ocellaris]